MKKIYDIVFLSNTPSFYKINLCNEIGKKRSVLLVLYGYGDEAVNTLLNPDETYDFDYYFLFEGNSSKRNKITVFLKLLLLMSRIKYKKILYSGWFVPEYNILSFFTSRRDNCLICESSIREVSFTGIKGFIKKKIINRMGVVLPSGTLHLEIFDSIGFKGHVVKTGGVGIFYKGDKGVGNKKCNTPLRYLYVGRLIDVKNLEFLVKAFNKNGKPLTIVGKGCLEASLKQMACKNIDFKGFIDNKDLPQIYKEHDIFILPSKLEPWGLVVEEAIYWGLPVVVSENVGSSIDLVKNLETGLIFKMDDQSNFDETLETLENNYSYYKNNVDKVDFDQRDLMQIDAYVKLVDLK